MTFRPGDILRDADNYVGPFRHHNPDLGVFMTVRAADTGAEIPRRATPPVTLVASARPACLTCRHWVAPDKVEEGTVENILASDALAGVCRTISIDLPGTIQGDTPSTGLAFAQNKGDASSCLRTRPSFGCVLHEDREVGDEWLEFDTVTRTDTMRSVRRRVALSGGGVDLAVVSFRRPLAKE